MHNKDTCVLPVLNLPCFTVLFSWPVLMIRFRFIPCHYSSNSSTIYSSLFIVCVLDFVCKTFYKNSML